MGRKKENHVYIHFNVDKIKLKSKCLVCDKDLNSINSSNLMKHLKIHKTQYEDVLALNIKQKETEKKSPNSKIVIRECTNLVTVHGRPLALLDDGAFQKIISLIPDCNAAVSSRKIRNEVLETARVLRDNTAKELQNKMICIKIDIASLSLRSFMGINAQYLEEGTIVLKNLGMIELFERHTSEHLKDQVMYVLQRFRIGLENIYSFTTDNGANMLKMGKLLNDKETVTLNQSVSSEANTDLMEVYSEDSEYISFENNSDSDFDNDADTGFDTDREEQLTETITSALSMHFHENTTQQNNVTVIRCAAHTLQLAVLKACNSAGIKQVISDARQFAKKLRTQKYANIISKAGKNQAILDCPTRWNSTIDMIERLIDLREVCDSANDTDVYLTESSWIILQDYLKSLLPAKYLSQRLQQEQLTIGDFYLQWMLCKIELKTVDTTLSNLLWDCMEQRELTLLNNDAFPCAVFLDGRMSSILSEDQRHEAKLKLLELHRHLKNLNNDKENTPTGSTSASSSGRSQTIDNARVELEDFLSTKYVEAQSDVQTLIRRRTDNMHSYMFRDLDEEITSFLKEPLIKSTENILKLWELNKLKYPRLYKLACVVLASPATQVSVERLFSSLKFVVSKYRLNLKGSFIEDIIFIRNNRLYNKTN